ncbi:MAG: tRNA (adenosine(37)-N6)-dimethylallyltransferase MiaA [Cyclobacteriaceae bacterium]
MDKKLIAIVGPTAVGKSAVAMELAERWRTEIISADSRQIFKEMEIGTAKPSAEELRRVRHHFINVKSIEEHYDAGQYGRDALELINQLFVKFDRLILCGGSGLYMKALLEGFDVMPEIAEGVREAIIDEYRAKGLNWLQKEVEKVDPEYFSEVDAKNPQRLMRALELYRASGKPLSALRKKQKKELPFEVVKIGLELPREELYQRIDKRMDAMIVQGLFDEAAKLYDRKELNALQTVGYQEIFGFMDGQYDREEAVRLLKRNSRHYAKRQLTWFKKDREIEWCRAGEVIEKF